MVVWDISIKNQNTSEEIHVNNQVFAYALRNTAVHQSPHAQHNL